MARLKELRNLVYSCLTCEFRLDARSLSFALYLRSAPNSITPRSRVSRHRIYLQAAIL